MLFRLDSFAFPNRDRWKHINNNTTGTVVLLINNNNNDWIKEKIEIDYNLIGLPFFASISHFRRRRCCVFVPPIVHLLCECVCIRLWKLWLIKTFPILSEWGYHHLCIIVIMPFRYAFFFFFGRRGRGIKTWSDSDNISSVWQGPFSTALHYYPSSHRSGAFSKNI